VSQIDRCAHALHAALYSAYASPVHASGGSDAGNLRAERERRACSVTAEADTALLYVVRTTYSSTERSTAAGAHSAARVRC